MTRRRARREWWWLCTLLCALVVASVAAADDERDEDRPRLVILKAQADPQAETLLIEGENLLRKNGEAPDRVRGGDAAPRRLRDGGGREGRRHLGDRADRLCAGRAVARALGDLGRAVRTLHRRFGTLGECYRTPPRSRSYSATRPPESVVQAGADL